MVVYRTIAEVGMVLKSMYKDFYFLILERKNDGFNIHRTKQIDAQINDLIQEYTLYVEFPERSNRLINLTNLIDETYGGVIDGEIKIRGGAKFITLLKKALQKKSTFFKKLYTHHQDIMKINRKVGHLIFSIKVDECNQWGDYLNPNRKRKEKKDLVLCLTDFFNHIRARTLLKDSILGYFWISLKMESSDERYVRIHLYISNKNFNNKVTDEIRDVWNSVLFKNKMRGGILFLTQTENAYKGVFEGCLDYTQKHYPCDRDEKTKDIEQTLSDEDNVDIWVRKTQRREIPFNIVSYPDWNGDEIAHHVTNEMTANQFKRYLMLLAKRAYQVPKARSIGLSNISRHKVKSQLEKLD